MPKRVKNDNQVHRLLHVKTRVMACATRRLDPFAARLLAIRLQQKRAADIKTEPAKTDTCCLNPDPLNIDSDEDDALCCNETEFGIGPVSTGCNDCGKEPAPPPNQDGTQGWAEWTEALNSPGDPLDGLVNMVKKLKTHVDVLETRIAELEQTTLRKSDGVDDTDYLP